MGYAAAALEGGTTEEDPLEELEQGICITKCDETHEVNGNPTSVAWKGDDIVVALATREVKVFGDEPLVHAVSSPPTWIEFSSKEPALCLVGCMGGEMLLWDSAVDQRIWEKKLSVKHVLRGHWAPDGRHFLAATRCGKVIVFARDSFDEVSTTTFTNEITVVRWVSDERFVVAQRGDHYLKYYNRSGQEGDVQDILGMNDAPYVTFNILAAAVHLAMELVLLGTDTGRVILVKIGQSGKQLRNYFGAEQGDYAVPSVAFSHDASFVYGTAVAGGSGYLLVWDTKTQAEVLRLPAHEKGIRCIALHREDDKLLTGSFDKRIKVWG